ncbi:hypothetical protein RI367_003694 [Sorochytrium milnesiophthora]
MPLVSRAKLLEQVPPPTAASASRFLSRGGLRLLRVVWMFYFLIALGFSLADWMEAGNKLYDWKWVFMFTHLNLLSLIAYFSVTVLLVNEIRRSTSVRALHGLLYSLNCALHPLVVIVFWVFLSSGFHSEKPVSQFVSVSAHGVTLLALISEFFFGTMMVARWAIVPVVIIIVLYTGWAYVWYAISRDWVYPFLDYHKRQAVYMYPGVLIAAIVFFVFTYFMHRLREHLLRHKVLINDKPMAGDSGVNMPSSDMELRNRDLV